MKAWVLGVAGIVLMLVAVLSLAEETYPACKAANERVDYGSGLAIPQNTRTLIESYRADWRAICDSASQRKPALADLFVKAKQIESDFTKVFEVFDDAILNEPNFDPKRLDIVTELVSLRYPAFVPAFKGAYGEHETFSPSLETFRENSALGTAEDRIFLESGIPLENDFPPFITRTWQYGGCDRYGEFDWTAAMKSIARVQKQVRNTAFLQETSQFEDKLFRELSPAGDICTCRATDAVARDYATIQKYLESEPRFAAHVPKILRTIDALQSGKIKVNSDAEKHCSGR